MRCFVAVDLSQETRDGIAGAQAAFRKAGPRADVAWVEPAKLHLTLKFMGEVAPPALDQVRSTLTEVASRHAPFVLTSAGLGGFPGRTRPRVLWAGLAAGLREIGLLAADVERACVPLGFPLDARPFRGHVTIGRVRSPRGVSRIIAAMESRDGQIFGSWEAREIVLYQSHLRPTGSVYEPLARLALGRPPGSDDDA